MPNEPFDLATWRSGRQQQFTLSSGLVVTVKKASLLDVAAQGLIPTPLVDTVAALVNQEMGAQSIMADMSQFARYAQVVDVMVKASVVSPPVADEADDTHLGISEIPMMDRIEIFNWAQQEGAPLAAFPVKPGASPDAARRGRRVPAAAQPAPAGGLAGPPD